MIDLGIDITTWGRFDKDTYAQLTEYVYGMKREGYQSLPEVLFVTIEQKNQILQYVDDEGLPIARQVEPGVPLHYDNLDKHHGLIYTFTLHTPLNVMWVRVVR